MVNLKFKPVKHPTQSTLGLKYFRNIVIILTTLQWISKLGKLFYTATPYLYPQTFSLHGIIFSFFIDTWE